MSEIYQNEYTHDARTPERQKRISATSYAIYTT